MRDCDVCGHQFDETGLDHWICSDTCEKVSVSNLPFPYFGQDLVKKSEYAEQVRRVKYDETVPTVPKSKQETKAAPLVPRTVECVSCGETFQPLTNMPTKYCSNTCINKTAKKQRDTDYTNKTGYTAPPCSKFQGTISELHVMEDLLRRGFMVFRNCAPHGSTDIVALERGPNKIPLRLEVKTTHSFEVDQRGNYELGVYFDHWARILREGGEVVYEPPLPEVKWKLEFEDENL